MSVKTLLLIGAIGYGYSFLKNNQLLAVEDSGNIKEPTDSLISNFETPVSPQGGITTTTGIDYDILVNYIPISNIDNYQLVYDVIYNNSRYTLYVLKNWKRNDIPKPFISIIEYNTLSDQQKQLYGLNEDIANGYKWYQVQKLDLNYRVIQNPPLTPQPGLTGSEIVSRSLPLGFIPVHFEKDQLRNVQITTGNDINILTPVNPSKANPKTDNTEIGLTVPLANLQRLRQTLATLGISDLRQLESYFVDGVKILKIIAVPTLNTFENVYRTISNSGLVYNIERLISQPIVKSADTYHPTPTASLL